MTARIAWISRTPVKALALEHLQEAELEEGGLESDRRFYLIGEAKKWFATRASQPIPAAVR